jgi:hypothetical protein
VSSNKRSVAADRHRASGDDELGLNDATSIWLVQVMGREIRLIDYYRPTSYGPWREPPLTFPATRDGR